MAAATFFHEFVVEGSGSFPIDMLRYDSCWPRTEIDSSKITFTGEPLERRQVELATLTRSPWEPTEGRWASFGWHVVSHSARRNT